MPHTEQTVVDAVETWLIANGFSDVRALPVGSRGYDIAAFRPATGQRWLIEAKGGAHNGTDGSKTACDRTGAAFMTAAAWRFQGGIAGDRFAIAIPSSKWFDIHVGRIWAALGVLGVSVFQVQNDGEVIFTEHLPL